MGNNSFRKTGFAAVLLSSLILSAPAAPDQPGPGKKGVGDVSGIAPRISGLKVSWYYNWKPEPGAGETKAEFVPMIWSGSFATDKILDSVKANPKYTHLLGFNEPDFSEQSAMSVDNAIEL